MLDLQHDTVQVMQLLKEKISLVIQTERLEEMQEHGMLMQRLLGIKLVQHLELEQSLYLLQEDEQVVMVM